MGIPILDHKTDYFQEVIEKDQAFISWMNTLHPDWQTWDYKQKRVYAKQFKFAENYGIKKERILEYLEPWRKP